MRHYILLCIMAFALLSCDEPGIKKVKYSQLDFHSNLSDFFQNFVNEFQAGTKSSEARQKEINAKASERLSENGYDDYHLVENWRCVFKGDWFDDLYDAELKQTYTSDGYTARCHYPMTTERLIFNTTLKNVGGAFEPKRLRLAEYTQFNDSTFFPFFTYWIDKGSLDEGRLQELSDKILSRSNVVLEFSGVVNRCDLKACYIRPAKMDVVSSYKEGTVINSTWWTIKNEVRKFIKGV